MKCKKLMNVKFNLAAPCLVLAPHLKYPINNGANILIDRRWAHFSKFVPYVDIVGEKTIRRYKESELITSNIYTNAYRSKYRAAANTVLNRSHYLLERFITPQFIRVTEEYLGNPEYKTIIFSLTCTASIFEKLQIKSKDQRDRLLLVETQNDEIVWYENIFHASQNPIAKLTASISKRWVEKFFSMYENDFIFIHLTDQDRDGYLTHFPDHAYVVAPAGVSVPKFHAQSFGKLSKIILLFVGALDVKMNHDALVFFREDFYTILQKNLGYNFEVVVAGSRPSKRMLQLCENMGWNLHADVTDEGISDLYQEAAFSLLPFPYTTGAKLKLLNSLAHGVPFLATTNLLHQVDEPLPVCLFSDDPVDWLAHIKRTLEVGISTDERRALVAYASKYSWGVIAKQIFETLQGLK